MITTLNLPKLSRAAYCWLRKDYFFNYNYYKND